MIRLRDLRIDYDNVCAVHDLTLEIEAGEVYGLIGPNGAGKTSTMRALAGLLEPTYGDVELAGIDLRLHPEAARQAVGFMPDFPPMYDDLMVWEFLDLFAASYFIPRGERPEAVGRHLEMVGLTSKRTALVGELSRGMRQRLMLAKTLLPQPDILLLDEPASGLDPNGRIELKRIIRRLADEGRTLLVSSHILAEMSEFCTSVGIMEKGRMVVSGRVEEIAAQVRGVEVLVVEVLDGEAEFRRIVGADRRAGDVTRNGAGFEFSFDGDTAAASELLSKLVHGGVRVSGFSRKRESLEDIFLQVGARELS